MKKIIFLLAICFTSFGFGQNDEVYVDELTLAFTKKLTERNITNYYTVKRYCSGRIEMFKLPERICTSKGTYYEVYVVWMEEYGAFIKKIDNCSLYYSVRLSDNKLYDFFISNLTVLKSEDVRNYKSATYSGKPELRKKPQPCFRSFQFTKGEATFFKRYNLFDISNDSDGKNLNYEFNSQLKVVILDAMLDAVLAISEEKMKRQI
jgi:hypothetical protein